jgi:hypothetical protein
MVNIINGSFTSNGSAKTLVLRGDLDSIEVWNATEMAAQNDSHGVSYYWQRGLAANNGFVTLRNAAHTAVDIRSSAALGVPGFTLVDSSVTTPGAVVATTDIGTVAHRVLTATTTGLSVGSIVRLANMTGAAEFNGMDFTVTAVNAGVHFDIGYTPVTVAAAAAGQYRIIPNDTLYYPRNRYIASISQAAQAVVVLTVTHNLQVGQQIRFHVPAMYGMVELEGLSGNIVAIDTTTNSITVDIDTTGFTAFAWPITAVASASAHTLPQIVPVGENTATALAAVPPVDILTDATINTGYIGIVLGAGDTSPAGSNNDVIYWRATTSFNL